MFNCSSIIILALINYQSWFVNFFFPWLPLWSIYLFVLVFLDHSAYGGRIGPKSGNGKVEMETPDWALYSCDRLWWDRVTIGKLYGPLASIVNQFGKSHQHQSLIKEFCVNKVWKIFVLTVQFVASCSIFSIV